MLLACFSKAQSNGNWQPLSFISGTNSINGVEAYSQATTCNGTEMVLLKFINHNYFAVRAGWKDMAVTKDNQHLSANTAQDSVSIGANSEVAGTCAGNMTQLALKLSDFGIDMNKFNYLIAIDFSFVKVH